MKRSPKLVLYAGFAACLFLVALVLGRPELTALGAPFALFLVIGLTFRRPAEAQVSLELSRGRVLEGETLDAEVVVRTRADAPLIDIALPLPAGIRFGELAWPTTSSTHRPNMAGRFIACVPAGQERRLPIKLVCESWGSYAMGGLVWRSSDAAGFRLIDRRASGNTMLRVYPTSERLRSAVKPFETQPFSGNRVARAAGEGIEFADTRPFVPGDRPRRVNWRATSVRQELYVNEQHPERNSDVVIFVDSFAEARSEGLSTLDLAVRAAGTLADHYLTVRDRVGLVSFGGRLRWLAPTSGDLQRLRVVEALLETQVVLSFAWRDIDVVPRHSLTPQALVIALTPLLDERSVGALLDLRRRGFDLVVIEITPDAFLGIQSSRALTQLGTRLWHLWRDTIRFRLEELGVAVLPWDGTAPLAQVVEEVTSLRRPARYVSV